MLKIRSSHPTVGIGYLKKCHILQIFDGYSDQKVRLTPFHGNGKYQKSLMENTGGVSDRRSHDSLSIYYIDKELCHRISETVPILCIKHVLK